MIEKSLGASLRRVLTVALLAVLVVLVVYPLLWMVLNALKTNAEVFSSPFSLPSQLDWSSFSAAWNEGVKSYLLTSVLLTATSTVVAELISAWAAFGLTRVVLPFGRVVTALILAGLMLAPTVAIVPLVEMFQRLHLYNTFLGLFILYTAFSIPFTTFLMRAYMTDLPREVDEAAAIDGASRAMTFWRIALPMSMPIVVTTTVLNILQNWNEYLFAAVFTSGTSIETLPVGLQQLMTRVGTHYPVVFAGMTIAAVPMVVLFFAAQRYLVRGLAGGVGK